MLRFLTRPCTYCGEQRIIAMSELGYYHWERGLDIKKALPELTGEDRALLVTGRCEACWKKMEIGHGRA